MGRVLGDRPGRRLLDATSVFTSPSNLQIHAARSGLQKLTAGRLFVLLQPQRTDRVETFLFFSFFLFRRNKKKRSWTLAAVPALSSRGRVC